MTDTLNDNFYRMKYKSQASPEQFATLLEFMESYGDITRPQQGPQGRIKADRLWQQLEELLNSIGGGVVKPRDKWKKVWADWKAKTKKKALAIRREASGTGGGPADNTLTASEERVLCIMGLTAVRRPTQLRGAVGSSERAHAGFKHPLNEPQVSLWLLRNAGSNLRQTVNKITIKESWKD
ncbi:uncharacterized protein LOC125074527 [Vanessa atalanta]|uniref:uncharacterized protein LOC125074527 n=1 Tax=Vanessa atalanta TaxID=42275 RepID=UPI001FCDD703|nr:uncharacterized protein LOC125074527 [Vanessa atalanta]